ncbi:hypothetical protein D3C86_1559950 [compost metagenome]
MAGDAIDRDVVGLAHPGDQVDEPLVLGVGEGIAAVAGVDDLDAEAEVVDVVAALELAGAGVPRALAVLHRLHDAAVLAHDVVGADLGRGVLEEVGVALEGAARRVVEDDGRDVLAAAGTVVVVGRGHLGDRGLLQAAAGQHAGPVVGLDRIETNGHGYTLQERAMVSQLSAWRPEIR